MDNNLIKIDDLVKQRLTDGEEKERAGAWSNMRALLDEQMPQKAPVAMFNWRRTMLAVAGLLLVAAVSIGGYEMMTSPVETNDLKDTNIAKASPADSKNVAGAVAEKSNNNNSNAEITSNTNTDKNNVKPSDNKADYKAVTKSVNADLAGTTVGGKKTADKKVTSTKVSSITPSSGVNTNVSNSKANNLNSNYLDKVTSPKNESLTPKSSVGQNKNAKQLAQAAPIVAGNSSTLNSKPDNNKPSNAVANNTDNKKTEQPAKPNKPKQELTDNKTVKNNNITPDNNRKEKQFKDSINMIATKEKYSVKEGWMRDTVEKTKVARFDVNPVDPEKATRVTDIIPSSALANEEDIVKLQPLEQKKVSAKKTKNTFGSNGNMFEEMVKNTKFNMSRITFHSGIMGGINGSLASSNTFGFQLGMFGVANISEHVSAFGEIKYMQRWGGGNSVYDNYNYNKQVTPSPTPGYVIHSWDSMDHSFKYPTLNSLHIPVAVRYAFKRFSLFCGGDFGYNFAVNTEEISQPQGTKIFQETPLNAHGLRFDESKTKPGITTADFAQRMDIGGMIGVSYSVTPATMIDLRVVQSMWNNAKTPGELKVFEELYNNPSVQFNISYRFSNNKFKAYRRQ